MTEWRGDPFDPEHIEEQEIRLMLWIYAVFEATPKGEADALTPGPSSGDVVVARDAAAGWMEIARPVAFR